MNMNFKRELFNPQEINEMYPVPSEARECKKRNDKQIRDVLDGTSSKLLLIIGPCSADREDAVVEFISRLRPVQEKVADKIVIVPRIYTNKPRTTGAGYKGMLHQPDPVAKPDIFKGLISIRKMHLKALTETGFSSADEMLYPQNYKYLDDLLAYNAVGARSVENQEHRLVASAIEGPVGMKNPTSGNLTVMLNAISAAQQGHSFIYRGWEGTSLGNPLAHAIMRGYQDPRGKCVSNYHYEDLVRLLEMYDKMELKNPACVVDTNHSNSNT